MRRATPCYRGARRFVVSMFTACGHHNRGRSGLLGRSLDYVSFFLAAAWRLWRIARPNDVVVAKTDPPLLSVMAAPIVWLRGARLVNWLQDIFPEVAEALKVGGPFGEVAFRLIRPLRNWSFGFARLNVVVAGGMAEHLRGEGIAREKIRIISNWSGGAPIAPIAAPANELRKNWALNGRFVVGYAGNLGRPHDIDTIIEAITLVQELALEIASEQCRSADHICLYRWWHSACEARAGSAAATIGECAHVSVSTPRAVGRNPERRRCPPDQS